jgi:hypothetical protein
MACGGADSQSSKPNCVARLWQADFGKCRPRIMRNATNFCGLYRQESVTAFRIGVNFVFPGIEPELIARVPK